MGWWKQKIALLIYVLQNVQGKISSSNDFSIVNFSYTPLSLGFSKGSFNIYMDTVLPFFE